MNVENPDKKSIMMYLMCLFKVLPHSDIPPVDESDLPLSPTSPLSPETEITQSVSASFVESSRQSGVSAMCLVIGLTLKAPIKTKADDKFHDIFPNSRQK